MRRKRERTPVEGYCLKIFGVWKAAEAENREGNETPGVQEFYKKPKPGKEAVGRRKHHGWQRQ
jgi:hypothetical protein